MAGNPRNIRMVVFLNRDEQLLLYSVCPTDATLAATIRRLALDRAGWLAGHGRKQQPILPAASPTGPPTAHPPGETWLDPADNQDLPPTPAVFRSMGRK